MGLLRKSAFKYGVPFFLLVVGGSFALKEFTQIRYRFSKKSVVREKMDEAGIPMKKPGEVTIETEYEKLKTMDIDTWEQVRGPRPWEENPAKA